MKGSLHESSNAQLRDSEEGRRWERQWGGEEVGEGAPLQGPGVQKPEDPRQGGSPPHRRAGPKVCPDLLVAVAAGLH